MPAALHLSFTSFIRSHKGSVLGPLLFIIYVADLVDIEGRHGVILHSFADDTQLYLYCHREDTTAAAAQLTDCVVDVSRWMTANRLRLNMDPYAPRSFGLGRDTACPNSRA